MTAMLLFCLLLTQVVQATAPIRHIFAFGDSLTSTGFKFQTPLPSVGNQFGNPKPAVGVGMIENWLNVLVKQLSPPTTLAWDFAVYGAVVNNTLEGQHSLIPDMVQQIRNFDHNLGTRPTGARWNATNSVFAIWFGANDVASNYQKGSYDAVNSKILDSYFQSCQLLYDLGARRFLMFSSYTLGRTPRYVNDPARPKIANDIASWNAMLSKHVSAWKTRHSSAKIETVMATTIIAQILDHPQQYGAPDNECQISQTQNHKCLFYDEKHPGTVIHAAIGRAAYAGLQRLGFYSSV